VEVAHVALGVDDQRRKAFRQRLFEQDYPESRFARPCHADDDPMGGQVGWVISDIVAGIVSVPGVDDMSEE